MFLIVSIIYFIVLYIVLASTSLLFYFFSFLRREDQPTVSCIVSKTNKTTYFRSKNSSLSVSFRSSDRLFTVSYFSVRS